MNCVEPAQSRRNSKNRHMPAQLPIAGAVPGLYCCSTVIVCGNPGRFGIHHSPITDQVSSWPRVLSPSGPFCVDAASLVVMVIYVQTKTFSGVEVLAHDSIRHQTLNAWFHLVYSSHFF
mgnify:CR=1 FL=1